MTHTAHTTGVVLFAHGSRDPLWRTPVEAIASRIRSLQPSSQVVCAYLELCEPSLPAALEQLATAGIQHIRVLPIFFGMGKHTREDLPHLISQWCASHPDVKLDVLPPAGEHAALTDLLAHVALGRH
ncbi:MAG TPA: CbiX/SirB N-terminal domain-containing protein [Burkholderiaceae bacterium]|nr:CbiX/SirB N-terminal domain-containing protein [Burkholderiaceae bacterium]